MTLNIKNTSCVILVGGESKRMGGCDKAQTKIKGKTLLRHVFEAVETCFDDIMISAHDSNYLADLDNTASNTKPRLITDTLPGRGPALGIAQALAEMKNEWLFALACDQPMVNNRAIEYLAGFLKGDYDIIVPISNGQLQTLFAFYRKTCLEPLRKRLSSKDPRRSLKGFIENTENLKVCYIKEEKIKSIDRDLLSFMDIDTPEELERIKEILIKE